MCYKLQVENIFVYPGVDAQVDKQERKHFILEASDLLAFERQTTISHGKEGNQILEYTFRGKISTPLQ